MWPSFSLNLLLIYAIVFVLGMLNIIVENKKWMILMASKFSFASHFKALLAGNAISLFLPYRAGEYLGRILHFTKKKWANVISSSMQSGLLQLACTIILGIICLPLALKLLTPLFILIGFSSVWIWVISIAILLILAIFFSYLPRLIKAVKIKFIIKHKISFSKKAISISLLLSLLRYLIFSFQYIIVLDYFDAMNWKMVCINLPVFLLLQTVIPTMVLSDIGLRFLLSFYLLGGQLALFPVFIIYCVNIFLPALVGVFFIHKKFRQ